MNGGGILHRIEIYRDDRGEWRYRGKARNHETVATGEGYKEKRDALATAARLFPNVPVREIEPDDEDSAPQ